MAVRITDNSKQVLAQMEGNVQEALEATGVKAVGMVVSQMQQGYARPIRKTGDLQRDVRYEVEANGKNTVSVGNTLNYAPFVHEGTYRMKARPYIKSAIEGQSAVFKEVAEAYLKKGF